MGAVYRAFDINLGVPVAVKENLFTTEEYARQFRREATILASLRHPNLPRVTDHFVIEGEGQYLVMDFIEGEDLRQRLERSGRVSEAEALPWFLEICDALVYLHSRTPPILHRDIKPGNIKVTPDSRAILVDFGLAKVVDESGSTTTGAKAMTPGFSPPEQYGTGRTDPRTDIYSLGATMYASLSASIPEDSLERAMGREQLTPLRQRASGVSPAASRSIEKALSVRPEERYQTVAEFAAALSSGAGSSRPTMVRNYPYLERTVVATGRKTAVPKLAPRSFEPRRKRWPVVGLSVLTMALITVGASFAMPDLRVRIANLLVPPTTNPGEVVPTLTLPRLATVTSTSAAVLPEDTATAEPSPTASSGPENPASLAAPTPTSTGGGVGQIAFASTRAQVPQIFLINIDGTGLFQVTDLPEGACQPSFSPDGRRIAFTSPCAGNYDLYQGSAIWMINVDGTGLQPLITTPGGDYDPAWSPDGERIAFTSLRGGRPQVYLLNLQDGSVVNLSQNGEMDSQPSWSPAGTQLLFISLRSGVAAIWLMPDLGEPQQQFSRSADRPNNHPQWSYDGQTILFTQPAGGIPRLLVSAYESRGNVETRLCTQGRLGGQAMREPSWSPDSRWIVFEAWPDGVNHDIALMTTGCTNHGLITTDPAYDFDPVWRP
jgi:serine/threonine protein kinase/Tol biopolymer transport system component